MPLRHIVAFIGSILFSCGAATACTCQDIAAANPGAPDGDYMILAGGKPFLAYCHDMQGTPSEFITLQRVGGGSNFSQYTAGGPSPGTNVRTYYQRIRLDPVTLDVDISDQTFTTSSGQLRHGTDWVTSMPYGVAMDCLGSNIPTGVGNVDLRDTPFFVDDSFWTGGWRANGTATFSHDNQVVDLTGGGFCGWMGTGCYNPYNDRCGWSLHLGLCTLEQPGDGVDQDCDSVEPCPCDGFKNHGQYVSCVAQIAGEQMQLGELTEEQRDCIVSLAAQSRCGKDDDAEPPDYAACFSACD